MTSGGNRNPANPETGGWMERMRRRRFPPTASFTHGRGTNPNGSRQVRAQCNSASKRYESTATSATSLNQALWGWSVDPERRVSAPASPSPQGAASIRRPDLGGGWTALAMVAENPPSTHPRKIKMRACLVSLLPFSRHNSQNDGPDDSTTDAVCRIGPER